MDKKNIMGKILLASIFVLFVFIIKREETPFFFLPFVFLWSKEHLYITRAAIETLPEREKKFLEPEKDLLWKVYCMFPDWNWPWYGEFGGEEGAPDLPRSEDLRRAWDISYYCGFDPITGKVPDYTPGIITTTMKMPPFFKKGMYKENLGYCPMGSYEAPKRYFPKVIDCWQNGLFADGMRFLGVLIHHIEDRGAFAYNPELHIKGHVSHPEKDIKLDSYTPKILGKTTEEAIYGIEQRMRTLSLFVEKEERKVAHFFSKGVISSAEKIILKIALETAKVVADTLHTAIQLVDCNKRVAEWYDYRGLPKMINLLQNPSFEINDGTGIPAGWVPKYYNPEDKVGRAEWICSRNHSIWFNVVRNGQYSVKLMWTPKEGIEWRQRWTCCIPVIKGQIFEYSGWIRTSKATGASYLVVYFYTRDNTFVSERKSKILSGTKDWQRISFRIKVPEKAEKMVAACRSNDNEGAVWFDDLELILIK